MKKVYAIIVTHNSERVISSCIESLKQQESVSAQCVVVDSGSADTACLMAFEDAHCSVLLTENIGFGRANNMGVNYLLEAGAGADDYFLFINPDVILSPSWVKNGISLLDARQDTGMLGGVLEGWDYGRNEPTGKIDSTGIFRKWFGRWYDRYQGAPVGSPDLYEQSVPALCGALLLMKGGCVRGLVEADKGVFDEDFFLYKEDIELSLRIKKMGWQLLFTPKLRAFHGRGWSRNRKAVPYELRLVSAWNEILLYRKHPSVYILWAILKYLLVRFAKI